MRYTLFAALAGGLLAFSLTSSAQQASPRLGRIRRLN